MTKREKLTRTDILRDLMDVHDKIRDMEASQSRTDCLTKLRFLIDNV